ncbi:unnamed protein product, partial [Iphiclides podalirius]
MLTRQYTDSKIFGIITIDSLHRWHVLCTSKCFNRATCSVGAATVSPASAGLINRSVFYPAVFPHAGPSGAYSPEATMGYMMDGQQMMHRPPTDPAFHQGYAHYPAEYYGHHL